MGRIGRLAYLSILSLLVGCGGCQERPQDPGPEAAVSATPPARPRRTPRVARATPVATPAPTRRPERTPVSATPGPLREEPEAPPSPEQTPEPAPEPRHEERTAIRSRPEAGSDTGAGERNPDAGSVAEPRAAPTATPVRRATGGERGQSGEWVGQDGAYAGATQIAGQGDEEPEDPYAEEAEPEPEDSDSQPPLVLSVTFDPPEAQDGSTVQVSIETEDNLSGAVSAAGSVESPSNKSFLSFAAGPSPNQPGLLVGQLRVPARAESGWWAVSFLRVMDAAQNAQAMTANRDVLLANSGFTVVSETPDTSLPVVHSVTLDPREVEEGEHFKVSVRVSDEGSGIKVVRGVLSSPGRAVRVNFFPRQHGGSEAYLATVSLPPFPEAGEWRVTLLTVHDRAGGRTIIGAGSPLLAEARIQVFSTREDTEPPNMGSIEFTPRVVRREDEVQILVDAWDDQSGVGAVDGWVRNESRTGRVHFNLHSMGAPNLFEGTVTLHRDASVGRWHVERLQITDKAGNRRVYIWEKDPELADAFFEAF